MRKFLQNLKNMVMGRRIALGLTSVRIGNNPVSILSRFSLVSLILLTIGVGQAWGDNCNYTLTNVASNVPVVYTGNNGKSGWRRVDYYNFPATTLCELTNSYGITNISFSIVKDGGANTANLKLQYWNGSSWQDAKNASNSTITCSVTYTGIIPKQQTTNVSVSIDPSSATGKASKFQLVRTNDVDFTDASRYFTISNVTVRMAPKLILATTADMEFEDLTYGVTPYPTKTRKVSYSSAETGKTMSVSTSNTTDFAVSLNSTSLGNDCTGDRTVTVTFKPQTIGDKTTTVTVSSNNGATSVTFDVIGHCDPADSQTTFSNETINVTTNTNEKVYSTQLPATDDGRTISYSVTGKFGEWSNISETGFVDRKFYATAAGVYTITATAAANTRYKAINSSFTITVNRVDQTLSWNNESDINENLNIKVGKTYDIKATSTSGLNVTYTTANGSYLKVNNGTSATTSNGCTLSAVAASGENTVTITASQAGNKQYNAATSLTKDFKVLDKQTPALYPSDSWTTSASKTSLKVGEQVTLRVDKVSSGLGASNTSAFYYTVSPAGALQASRDGDNVTITAYSEATNATITFYQKENDDIFGDNWSYNFAISKNEPTINVPGNQTLDVDGEYSATLSYTNVSASVPAEGEEGHDFYYSISHSQTTSVNKNNQVITFNPSTGKIVAQNAGTATITIAQKATREYSAKSTSFTITVNKIANTLSVASETYTGKYVDDVIAGIISNKNSDAAVTTTSAITGMSNEDAAKVAYYKVSDNKIYMPNTDAVSFASKTVTINIAQAETYKYESVSKNITLTVNKYPTSFTGSAYNLMVDGTQTADYSWTNTSAAQPTASSNDDFYYTIDNVSFTNSAKNNGNNLVVFNPGNKLITACNAGTAKITLHQKETYKYTGATQSFNVAVYKYNSVFSGQATLNTTVEASPVTSGYVLTYTKPDNAYIGDANHTAGTPALNSGNWYYTLGHNITTANQVGCPNEYQDVVISYNAENKQATGRNQGAATVSLYQVETYKYNSASTSFNVNVAKNANALSCSWNSWSKDMSVDSETGVTISANNAQTPIVVEQTSGDDEGNVIATYSSTNNKITSIYNIGTATWSVSQAENYKYVAAESKTLTVNVKKASQPTCYVIDHADEQSVSSLWWEGDEYCEAIALDGIGESLVSFEAKKDGGTGDVSVVQYSKDNGQNWTTLRYEFGISSDFQKFGPFAFPALSNGERITHIRFGISGTTSGISYRYKNIKVSRKKWFKLKDKDGNEISSLEMPTNTLGGNHTTAKFTVDYSTCADQIKVVSNHPHITVSPASFASEGNGTKEITVTYACDDPESIEGVITVYTPYENKTINVHAATEKKSQEIEWSDLFVGETVSLPQTFTSNDAASATSKLPVTYTSGNSKIIEVAENGLSFTVVGTGTTTLTAMQSGNDLWKLTSDTKTINASNKKIQRIKWNQQFTRSLAPGQEIPLTATVTVLNIATGVETESVERSAEIVYTCPTNNGVIEILNETNIRVLGYGNTTITASVAGNEEYEAAAPVTLPVRVREIQTGDCDMPLVLEQNDEIEFFQGNTQQITGSAIAINHANGIPDKLSFDVRGAAWKLAIEYYKGGIIAQQSIDNQMNWSDLTPTAISPAKGETVSSDEIQLNPNATHIRFIRPSGGQGYHYVGNIHITRLPYLETESATIDLGNISVGEKRDFTIPVSYCSVRGNMSISKQYSDNGLTIDELIEAECGDMNTYDIQASILPTVVGPWSNMVTVRDPLSNMYLNVTINATIQKGDQVITWNPTLEILATEAPVLNAVASSNLAVSYAVTSGNNTVARIDNGQVVILQPGTFAITASQNGNSNYNAAPQLVKTFTVTAETLTLLEVPTATGLTYGQTLSASTLTGGSVEDSKHNPVAGTFSWQVGNTMPNAGEEQEMAVVFTPSLNPAWYNTLQTNAEITVIKATPSMTANDVVLTYGAAASSVELSTATGSVAGNWTWTDSRKEDMLAAGNYTMDVHFTPTGADANNYNELNTTVSVTVDKANTTLSWTNAPENVAHDATGVVYAASSASDGAVTYAIIAGGSYASIDAESGELTILEPGHEITVQASQAAGTNYNAPSAITVTVTVEAAPVGPNTFTGAEDSDWDNPNNWSNGLPTDEKPDVIVKGDLIINEDVSVGGLTIEQTGSVAIITGGTLTVAGVTEDRENGYGDMHVANDGVLALGNSAQLEVRHFMLDAKLTGIDSNDAPVRAASGQVSDEEKLHINGDAYFQITFDPRGYIDKGWYEFVLPFDVEVVGGLFFTDMTPMTYGVDYLMAAFSESRRANGQKPWYNFSGTMKAGKSYTITLDETRDLAGRTALNTVIFKKKDNADFGAPASYEAEYTPSGDNSMSGWNGFGNGTLIHRELNSLPDKAKVQVYNHGSNDYTGYEADEYTYAVGTSFFFQVASASLIALDEASSNRGFMAPARERRTIDEYRLSLTKENCNYAADRLWFSASEEATDAYVIGNDLMKMGTPTDAKVAQMWAVKGGKNLCDVEAPMKNDKANTSLSFYAPQTGIYTLSIDKAPADAMLYLTYNNRVIWNLSYSPYDFELTKGTTEGYGLRLVAQTPTVTTDLENEGLMNDANGVRKVLIDDQVYLITPDGKVYDLMGKCVKY